MSESLLRRVAKEIDGVAYAMKPANYDLKTEKQMLDQTPVGALRRIAEHKARKIIRMVRSCKPAAQRDA